jgi:hypothetical protein
VWGGWGGGIFVCERERASERSSKKNLAPLDELKDVVKNRQSYSTVEAVRGLAEENTKREEGGKAYFVLSNTSRKVTEM